MTMTDRCDTYLVIVLRTMLLLSVIVTSCRAVVDNVQCVASESCSTLFSVAHDRGDWNERRSYTNDGYRRETDDVSTVHLSQIYLVTPSADNLNIAACRERAFPASRPRDARQALAKSGKGIFSEQVSISMYECVRERA